jgi:ribose/xylose/arabinose/galactoside ABC-type transport system permease subunit
VTGMPRPRLDRRHIDIWFLGAATVAILVVFAALSPAWLNWQLIPSLIDQNAPLALVAAAMTLSIIARHIDLSPASMIGLVGSVVGLVIVHTGSTALAVLAGLTVALAVALLHGILVVRFGLSAIMVTLAAYIWARGLALGITDADPIEVGGPLVSIMRFDVGGFSIAGPLVLFAYLLAAFTLTRTKLGLYTYAMGGDALAARRQGLRVARYTIVVFAIMGVAVTLAALISVGELASAQPRVASGLELDAIIAVVIGGTRLAGGEGSVGRTALGVVFLAILNSGLANLGLTAAYSQLYQAIALLSVLSIQVVLRRVAAADRTRRHQRSFELTGTADA